MPALSDCFELARRTHCIRSRPGQWPNSVRWASPGRGRYWAARASPDPTEEHDRDSDDQQWNAAEPELPSIRGVRIGSVLAAEALVRHGLPHGDLRRVLGACRDSGPDAALCHALSDAFDRFQSARSDRVGEGLVVALVLVGVALGEVDDRLVERVASCPGTRRSRSGLRSGRARGRASIRIGARRTRARPASSTRPRRSPSCHGAGASRGSGSLARPSSSPGRCRSRPASAAALSRRARRAACSGSSAGDPRAPRPSPP